MRYLKKRKDSKIVTHQWQYPGDGKNIRAELLKEQQGFNEGDYYGKACCHALQGNLEATIVPLQKVIELAPRNTRREAKHNPDFEAIRADERFRALVYPTEDRLPEA